MKLTRVLIGSYDRVKQNKKKQTQETTISILSTDI